MSAPKGGGSTLAQKYIRDYKMRGVDNRNQVNTDKGFKIEKFVTREQQGTYTNLQAQIKTATEAEFDPNSRKIPSKRSQNFPANGSLVRLAGGPAPSAGRNPGSAGNEQIDIKKATDKTIDVFSQTAITENAVDLFYDAKKGPQVRPSATPTY